MAGNVWEWTRSLHRPYPYRANDGRELFEGEGSRVVRGGSWRALRDDARCAYREGFDPANRVNFVGFRVVLRLPPA
jgi:formylglycine-generating enzyme required for sulfatase activity